jgi:hypothetical protein
MELSIKKAVRRALPLQIGFYGPSSSGKTMSALLFAAGLAGPDGKVVVIDTERGRASVYSDNKRVMEALPNGYDVVELDQPYHPLRFIKAIDLCESANYKVCLIDSESDSWDGPGGCADITEGNNGRWNKAKLANKKMKTRIALSDMHCISLFKAQEKSKILDKTKSATGKEEVINLGMLPISEKNAFYPLLLGFSVEPKTHMAEAVKCHEDLAPFFLKPKLITKEDGERVRKWNEAAPAMAPYDQLTKRAAASAESGVASYQEFWNSITAPQRKALAHVHLANKAAAEQADMDAATVSEDLPDPMSLDPGSFIDHGGKRFTNVGMGGEPGWREVAANG